MPTMRELNCVLRKMKLFRRNQNKDNDTVEKPIVTYYAKYIGVIRSNKSFPVEEGAYVHIYEDRIGVDLLESKFKTTIPYKNMTVLIAFSLFSFLKYSFIQTSHYQLLKHLKSSMCHSLNSANNIHMELHQVHHCPSPYPNYSLLEMRLLLLDYCKD